MATKTAVEIANDIRKVEYACAICNESESGAEFLTSLDLATFWQQVDDLDLQVQKVRGTYEEKTGFKWDELDEYMTLFG